LIQPAVADMTPFAPSGCPTDYMAAPPLQNAPHFPHQHSSFSWLFKLWTRAVLEQEATEPPARCKSPQVVVFPPHPPATRPFHSSDPPYYLLRQNDDYPAPVWLHMRSRHGLRVPQLTSPRFGPLRNISSFCARMPAIEIGLEV